MIKVCHDEDSLAETAAEAFVEQFKKTIDKSNVFRLVLSGGVTPIRTYELLGQEPFKSDVDWSRVHVFWGDERCVTFTDSRSNYGMAQEHLLSRVPIPARQIHPIRCTHDPYKSAVEYEAIVRESFGKSPPRFDLVFLGLGKDGHTASLFPDSSALMEHVRWVTHVQNQGEGFARITMTTPILNQARLVIFLVTGPEKSEILKQMLSVNKPLDSLPAQLIHPTGGKLLWLVDQKSSGQKS